MREAYTDTGVLIRKAPEGKFRLTGYDSFSHDDWFEEDFDSVEDANRAASRKGGEMTLMYVWDDRGRQISKAGAY